MSRRESSGAAYPLLLTAVLNFQLHSPPLPELLLEILEFPLLDFQLHSPALPNRILRILHHSLHIFFFTVYTLNN